jgi:hypothetical protein
MVVIMEVTYGTASYAYTYDRHLQTFQVGVNYVNYGSFKDTMNQANLPLHLLEVKLHFQQGMPTIFLILLFI